MQQLLRPAPLLILASLSLAIAAGIRTAPFGLFLVALLLSWTAKYTIAILDAVMNGARTLPVLSVEMVLSTLQNWRLLLCLCVATVLLFLTATSFGIAGRAILVGLAAALTLALPAVLVVQAWTGDTLQAVQPKALIGVARLLGNDYLTLVLLTAGALLTVAATALFPLLPARVFVTLLAWFLIVVQAARAVHDHRAAFEETTLFPPVVDLTDDARQLAAAREHAADEIYAHWRGGAQVDAWKAARRHASRSRHPADEYAWLLRRVSVWDAKPLEQQIRDALAEQLRQG